MNTLAFKITVIFLYLILIALSIALIIPGIITGVIVLSITGITYSIDAIKDMNMKRKNDSKI